MNFLVRAGKQFSSVEYTLGNEMTGLQIYVDADACPVKSIIAEEAALYQSKAWFICSVASHFVLQGPWLETITVDKGFQSVDMYIANRASPGDLIITDDYGLACMVLARNCLAMNSRGKEYTNNNIDQLLMNRFHNQKARNAGKRTRGPKPLLADEKEQFRQSLKKCLEKKAGNC